MRSLLIEELTWPEVEEALAKGMKTIIIYAGSIEQHGRHLAENADAVAGYAQAADLAKRLGNALVAPVIRPGLSAHHLAFPGSLTLRPEVFKGVVEDYISSYIHHGFDKIVLSSSHGGNFDALEEVANASKIKYPNVRFATGYSMKDLANLINEAEKEEQLKTGTCGGHGCDYETSTMLLHSPQYVFMVKAEAGYIDTLTMELIEKMRREGIKGITPNGVLGDPAGSNIERGKRYFDKIQQFQEDRVRKELGI
ncbi:MAG: creatininase family protein [Treponema sp.]|nr:creatininase family protein [Treponema sp.]